MIPSLPTLVAGLLAFAFRAAAATSDFETCTTPRSPEPDSIQTIQLIHRDAGGGQAVTSANLYGERSHSGAIRLLVRPTRPEELRGTFLSFTLREDETVIFFGSPELPAPKRIHGAEALGALFGSDFSYADFASLQGLAQPMTKRRLADTVVAGRPVFVAELKPVDPSRSSYARIVASFDQVSCVPLRSEMYEPDGKLRKLQTIDPAQVVHSTSLDRYLPQRIEIRDQRDLTSTTLDLISADFEVSRSSVIFGTPQPVEPDAK
jgi:hypothetical protein